VDVALQQFAASVPLPVRRVLRQARTLCDAAAVERAVDQLAVRVSLAVQNEDPWLLTLLPQGLVLGGMLMRRLVFPCRQAAVTLNPQGLPQWQRSPADAGTRVVLISAWLDAPQARSLQDWAAARHFDSVVLAALAAPRHLRKTLAALPEKSPGARLQVCVGVEVERQPAFGSGFELMGYGANLPGLYDLINAQKGKV